MERLEVGLGDMKGLLLLCLSIIFVLYSSVQMRYNELGNI